MNGEKIGKSVFFLSSSSEETSCGKKDDSDDGVEGRKICFGIEKKRTIFINFVSMGKNDGLRTKLNLCLNTL